MRINIKMTSARRSDPKTVTLKAARERLAAYIASRQLKTTKQRDVILDVFFSVPGHLSIEDVVEHARVHGHKVGPATVYRTMKLLTEAGLASARHFEGGTKYEAAFDRHHHDHLICVRCGGIEEFENERIEELQDRVAREHGFVVTHHKLELYGYCRNCREEKRPPARP
ncbi:MAG TPA: transcriptional repressor [Myxococcales bacterium]|nr:transcriptional repressor [Myxococcales bacterium]